jgi:sugar/nucleoside kinase (ribokinase family)
MKIDLAVMGNLVVDDLVFTDGRTRMGEPGGAVLYAALGAAIHEDVRVSIVAPVGDDYPRAALDALRERGVDLSGLRPLGGPGLRTWLLYEPAGRRIVPRRGCPSHEAATPTPSDLASQGAQARAVHLTPAPIWSQKALLKALAERGGACHVSLDPHEPVTAESLRAWRPAFGLLDAFFVSADEVRLPGEPPASALAAEAGPGDRMRRVLLKQGERGGLLHDRATGRELVWPARTGALVVDPTGAGDAFAGGFLAGLLLGEPDHVALTRGLVSASFAIEGWGAAGLLAATSNAARSRFESWLGDDQPTQPIVIPSKRHGS